MLRSLLALIALSGMFTACTTVPADTFNTNEDKPTSGPLQVTADAAGASAFSPYTAVMTPSERYQFSALKESDHQWRYIRGQGIDVRREMADRLQVGMDKPTVKAALAGLDGVPMKRKDGSLLYRVYNGTSSTYMSCSFGSEGALVSWVSYTDNEVAHHSSIEEASEDLRVRLDAVLRKGMGVNEIRRSVNKAKQLVAEFETQMRDRVTSEDSYSGMHAPSEDGDFHVAAEIHRARAIVKAYEVLDRDPDHIRREVNSEYWYHIVPSMLDDDRYIVIEYRFEHSKLISWYVYPTDFLGFGEWKHQ